MSQQDQLADLFATSFLTGKAYASIVEARSQAAQLLNQPVRPGSPLAKLVDESVEAGLVRAARTIIGQSEDPLKTYTELVDLTDRQPRLGVRGPQLASDNRHTLLRYRSLTWQLTSLGLRAIPPCMNRVQVMGHWS